MTVDDLMALAARCFSRFDDVPQLELRRAIEQALAEAVAVERERISDGVWDAVVSDCENGVKWLNESASEKLQTSYPELWSAISTIRGTT